MRRLDDGGYAALLQRLRGLLEGETDWVAAMATVACELHIALAGRSSWTGFYRHCAVHGELDRKAAQGHPTLLRVGPYQGGHGCMRIALARGVCGTAAATGQTQLHDDVTVLENHIACSSATLSEVVVPIRAPGGALLGVLDLDSEERAAFTQVDRRHLETLCAELGEQFAAEGLPLPRG